MINYRPDEITSFHCYIYEWIDNLSFCIDPSIEIENCEQYERAARAKFLSCQWTGNGKIRLMWVPPFALKGVLDGGIDSFMEKFGKSWSQGLTLWHTKQDEDGLSFILSPVKLAIPDFGLEM